MYAQELLDRLDRISDKISYKNDHDEVVTVSAHYLDHETLDHYYLNVEVIAHKDRRGKYVELIGYDIHRISYYKNDGEDAGEISRSEIAKTLDHAN